MVKLILKTKNLLILSVTLITLGLIICGLGFVVADNKLDNFATSKTKPWYQTISYSQDEGMQVGVTFGDLHFMEIN